MPEAPPVHLPGAGYLLPDGTHVTEQQAADGVERMLQLCTLIEQLLTPIGEPQ